MPDYIQNDILRFILERKSTGRLVEPALSRTELETVLEAGASVPDHGLLHPWRFIVITGHGLERFGNAIASARQQEDPEVAPELVERLRAKPCAAPMVIAIVASPDPNHKVIPMWEQLASAAQTGYAMHLASLALGYSSAWRSTSHRRGAALRHFCQMTEHEELLGWIQIGTQDPESSPRPARVKPDFREVTMVIDDLGMRSWRKPDPHIDGGELLGLS